jgi:hypothetical protein
LIFEIKVDISIATCEEDIDMTPYYSKPISMNRREKIQFSLESSVK